MALPSNEPLPFGNVNSNNEIESVRFNKLIVTLHNPSPASGVPKTDD
jgi:hypothetical protein